MDLPRNRHPRFPMKPKPCHFDENFKSVDYYKGSNRSYKSNHIYYRHERKVDKDIGLEYTYESNGFFLVFKFFNNFQC